MEQHIIKNKFSKYVGTDKPVEIRFSNMLFLGTCTIGLAYAIMGLIFLFQWQTSCICLVMSIGAGWMYYLSLKTKKEIQIARISLIFMNFLFFPAIYLTSGGIHCGAISFFVLGLIFSYLMFTGKICWVVTTLEVVCYIFVIYASYKWKMLFDYEISKQQAYCMTAVNVVVVALAIGLLVRVLITQYSKEKKNIEKTVLELETLSTKDPLTGVYNRRYMLNFLDQNIKRANEYGAKLSIVIFDIDYFKSLNDDFGHLVGDEILVNLSEIFTTQLRSNDMISRFGGEEFVAVFPNTASDIAFNRAEEIRQAVANATLSKSVNRPITISGGVAAYGRGMTIEELIDLADKNLYVAKESGRNAVCVNRENEWEEATSEGKSKR
ncbi:MAG: GGDEF domain-containing protein [Oscillospiraceae bacterium]